ESCAENAAIEFGVDVGDIELAEQYGRIVFEGVVHDATVFGGQQELASTRQEFEVRHTLWGVFQVDGVEFEVAFRYGRRFTRAAIVSDVPLAVGGRLVGVGGLVRARRLAFVGRCRLAGGVVGAGARWPTAAAAVTS